MITKLTETDNYRTLQIINLAISQSCLCLIIEECTRALQGLDTLAKRQCIKVTGIRPLAPVQNSVSLKLMQRKTLNVVINLPDVENITK